jgi:hypothetical protein
VGGYIKGTSIYSVERFVIPDLIGDPFVLHRENGLAGAAAPSAINAVGVAVPLSRE